MSVRNILETKGREVVTIGSEATLGDAAALLSQKRIGALVVSDGEGRVEGIISERDVVRMIGRDGADVLSQPIHACMTKAVAIADEDTSLDEAMEKMTSGRFRHLPICRDGRLVGLVSIGDAVKQRLEDMHREAENMRSYIHSA